MFSKYLPSGKGVFQILSTVHLTLFMSHNPSIKQSLEYLKAALDIKTFLYWALRLSIYSLCSMLLYDAAFLFELDSRQWERKLEYRAVLHFTFKLLVVLMFMEVNIMFSPPRDLPVNRIVVAVLVRGLFPARYL